MCDNEAVTGNRNELFFNLGPDHGAYPQAAADDAHSPLRHTPPPLGEYSSDENGLDLNVEDVMRGGARRKRSNPRGGAMMQPGSVASSYSDEPIRDCEEPGMRFTAGDDSEESSVSLTLGGRHRQSSGTWGITWRSTGKIAIVLLLSHHLSISNKS